MQIPIDSRLGFPIRRSRDPLVCSSPWLIAAYHVLHRLSAPRHPPYTLSNLTALIPLPETVVKQKLRSLAHDLGKCWMCVAITAALCTVQRTSFLAHDTVEQQSLFSMQHENSRLPRCSRLFLTYPILQLSKSNATASSGCC